MNNNVHNVHNMNLIIIEYICMAYSQGRFEDLKRIGVPLDIAKQLAKLSMLCVTNLVDFRIPIFKLTVEADNFAHLMSHIENESRRDDKIHTLVARGATFTVLAELTGASRSEFNALCYKVGVEAKSNSGKPRNLTDAEITQLTDCWDDTTTPLELDLLWTLVTETHLPVGPVWRWMQSGADI